jgi:serine/threonine protein kinase
LADFGFARFVSPDTKLKMTMGIGTPFLMAPEVYDSDDYTAAVDVYALAVTMWMAFTDRLVGDFQGGERAVDGEQFVRKIRNGERLVKPGRCPDCWWEVISVGWSHSPDERPTAGRIAEMLEDPQFVLEPEKRDEYLEYIQEIKRFKIED